MIPAIAWAPLLTGDLEAALTYETRARIAQLLSSRSAAQDRAAFSLNRKLLLNAINAARQMLTVAQSKRVRFFRTRPVTNLSDYAVSVASQDVFPPMATQAKLSELYAAQIAIVIRGFV